VPLRYQRSAALDGLLLRNKADVRQKTAPIPADTARRSALSWNPGEANLLPARGRHDTSSSAQALLAAASDLAALLAHCLDL
jgi:hypothetical protein